MCALAVERKRWFARENGSSQVLANISNNNANASRCVHILLNHSQLTPIHTVIFEMPSHAHARCQKVSVFAKLQVHNRTKRPFIYLFRVGCSNVRICAFFVLLCPNQPLFLHSFPTTIRMMIIPSANPATHADWCGQCVNQHLFIRSHQGDSSILVSLFRTKCSACIWCTMAELAKLAIHSIQFCCTPSRHMSYKWKVIGKLCRCVETKTLPLATCRHERQHEIWLERNFILFLLLNFCVFLQKPHFHEAQVRTNEMKIFCFFFVVAVVGCC